MRGAEIPDSAALLEEAAQAGIRSQDAQTRALCLAEVAATRAPLSPIRRNALLEHALEIARGIGDPAARALALRTVALRVARLDRARAWEIGQEALTIAGGLQAPVEAAMVLRELAVLAWRTNPAMAPQVCEQARAQAHRVEPATYRVACLRDLATAMVAFDETWARQVLAEARQVLLGAPPQEAELPMARAELAAAYAPLDLDAAQELLEAIGDPVTREEAISSVAWAIASQSPDRVLVVAQWLPEGPARAHVMAAAAAALPPDLAPLGADLARTALAMAAGDTGERADDTRVGVAVALVRTAPEEALTVLQQMADPERRDAAIAAVAERRAESDPLAAAELLSQVDDLPAVEPVLARIAPRLAKKHPTEALEMARKLLSRRLRCLALVGIAEALYGGPTEAPGEGTAQPPAQETP